MIKALSILPRYGICALLIFTPLARASVQGWAISTVQLVTVLILAAFLLEKTWTGNWQWVHTPLDKPIACLIVLTVLCTVFSLHVRTSIASVMLLLNYLVIFYMVIHTVSSRSALRQLTYLITGIAACLSFFGLFKYMDANPFPWWHYADLKDAYQSRLTATFGNPDHLAGYMEMTLPLLLGLFLMGFKRGKRLMLIYSAILLTSALILSLSRGAWIGICCGLSFMAIVLLLRKDFIRKKLIIGLMAGVIFVVLIVLTTTPAVERIRTVLEKGQDSSLYSRLIVWKETIAMIGDYPLIGTGPGTFATAFTRYQPPGLNSTYTMTHNDYLHFISETGLFFIPLTVWMGIVVFRKGMEKINNPSRLIRGTTLGALSGITAILVHSIFDFNLHIPANAILFTILAAIVVTPIPRGLPHTTSAAGGR